MKNWIIALSILIIPMVTYFALEKTHGDTAFKAMAVNKPTVFKFSSPMCIDCKKMDSTIEAVMPNYSDKVVYENINTQSNDKRTAALIKKYNVLLVPTCIFLKSDGSLYKRVEGYMDKKEFESHLKGLING